MSWKYTFGQIVGVVIGVTVGSAAVNYVIRSTRQPQPQPQQYEEIVYSSPPPQENYSVYDQVVSGISTRPA
jgi:hypothetical protein